MRPRFTPEQVQAARDTSLHNLLHVRNTGRRISMNCPFPDHNDSSPSFSLYPDNSCHCYGCPNGGWHGHNAIDFTMRLLDVDFNEAVAELINYPTDK
jgi:DNA primase